MTIPGAEAAVRATRGHVGILATARTVASGTYVAEVHELAPAVRVTQRAAPLLAPIVEEDTDLARLAVGRYLADLRGVDTLLLACTHYPLLRAAFDAQAPAGVAVLDPGPFTAERLEDWLARHPGFDAEGAGTLRVLCTGDPEAFARHGRRFLGDALPAVEPVAEVGGRLAHRDPGDAPVGQVVRR